MLDFIGLILIILFFIRGCMKGIIVAAFSVLSVLLGVVCALKVSGIFAEYLLNKGWVNTAWAQIISYIILFTAVMIIVRMLAKAVKSSLRLIMLGWADGLLGGILYAFATAVCWSVALWLATQIHLISPKTIADSKTYPYFISFAPKVFDGIGKLLPFAKNLFTDLAPFFDKIP